MNSEINFARWKKVILISQFIIAGFIFCAEAYGNTVLYITRSQGYGPDTILVKLLRYLVLTTAVNVLTIACSQRIVKAVKNQHVQKYVLIFSTEILCCVTAWSHYQFSSAFAALSIPILLSILYEDLILTGWTAGFSAAGLIVAVILRAADPLYCQDIAVEAVIALTIQTACFVLSCVILNSMAQSRAELNRALVGAEKTKYIEQVEQMSSQIVEALASAIDAKDKYTNGHSFRVAEYSAMVAAELGWPPERIRKLRYEALLHDTGKIGIPDSVLNKKGKLTEMEFGVIKSHTTIGADILRSLTTLPGAKYVAKSHHERFDGTGYPAGLKGDEIPVNARIVGLADAFDAMNSNRIYRKALNSRDIREELVKGRGTQFDPELLDIFLELFDRGSLKIRAPYESEESAVRGVPEELVSDLREYVDKIAGDGEYQGAFTLEDGDFSRMYAYLKKLGQRYGHSLEVVCISLRVEDGQTIGADEMKNASEALETSIQKNVRTVDVCIRHGSSFITIMLDAGLENIDMIIQRIFLDYYKLYGNKKIQPYYEVNA